MALDAGIGQTGAMTQQEFGAYLTRLRTLAGYKSASAFGKAVGISSNAMNDLEKGRRRPKPETVRQITDTLNSIFKRRPGMPALEFAVLLRLSGNTVPDEAMTREPSPFSVEVLAICERVPEPGREVLLRMIRDAAALVTAAYPRPKSPYRQWLDQRIDIMSEEEEADLQRQLMQFDAPDLRRKGLPRIRAARARVADV